jgi:glycogen synthase
MNILLICDEYPPCKHGGIGTVTQNLAREFVALNHNVFVCGFYPYYRIGKEFESDMGVKVFRKFYGNYLKLKLSKHPLFGKIFKINKEFSLYLEFLEELIIKEQIDIIEIPDFNE